MLGNVKISTQLMVLFCAIAICSIIIGLLGLKCIRNSISDLEEIEKVRLPGVQQLLTIDEAQTAVIVGERGLINNSMMDSDIRQAQYDWIEASRERVYVSMKNYKSLPKTADESILWEEFLSQWEKWVSDDSKVVDLSRRVDALLASGMNAANPKVQELQQQVFQASLQSRQSYLQANGYLDKLVAMNEEIAHDNGVKATAEGAFNQKLLLIAMIINVLLALVLGTYLIEVLKRRLMRPVQEMAAISKLASSGDLTVEIGIKSDDEIGQLAAALQAMIRQMRNMVNLVAQKAVSVAGSAEELNASAQQTSANANETAAAMSQIATAVTQVASNIQDISTAAVITNEHATSGKEGIGQVTGQMKLISDSSLEVSKVINGLSQKSQEINQIVELITHIADQTNLLALNAAIEAGRAGEQGRGFAVVAEEVRKLAEQSAQAAKEIKQLIGAIQKESNLAVASMQEGSKQVDTGSQVVYEVSQSFKEIINAVETLGQQIQEAASAVEETTAGVEEVAASTEEQTAAMEEVSASADNLSALAGQLNELVGKFKI